MKGNCVSVVLHSLEIASVEEEQVSVLTYSLVFTLHCVQGNQSQHCLPLVGVHECLPISSVIQRKRERERNGWLVGWLVG